MSQVKSEFYQKYLCSFSNYLISNTFSMVVHLIRDINVDFGIFQLKAKTNKNVLTSKFLFFISKNK